MPSVLGKKTAIQLATGEPSMRQGYAALQLGADESRCSEARRSRSVLDDIGDRAGAADGECDRGRVGNCGRTDFRSADDGQRIATVCGETGNFLTGTARTNHEKERGKKCGAKPFAPREEPEEEDTRQYERAVERCASSGG